MSAFRVKLGANDLNCVDVPLNPTHSLTHLAWALVLSHVMLYYTGSLREKEICCLEPAQR